MNIAEMHLNFREYAQQMGMQNVRAILPDQIDIYINQAIDDEVNQLIRENIVISSKDGRIDSSKLGQVNALRTLYDVRTKRITFYDIDEEHKRFDYNPINANMGLIKHTGSFKDDDLFGDYMFIVELSINYISNNSDNFVTQWCPIRIIDDAYLSKTLNDVILKNSFRSPIGVIYKDNSLELYIDKFNPLNEGETIPSINVKGKRDLVLSPYELRISFINKPKQVRFFEDVNLVKESVDCDLPEFMHGNIVKRAVDLYRVTINGSLNNTQQG